ALDPATLAEAVAGTDAVACCLGQRRAGQSPWSAPLSPPDLMERITPSLVEAMQDAGVRRLALVSAAGVAESYERLSGPVRWLVRQGQIGVAYRDLEAAEQALAGSGLDWLAVRPVTLANGGPADRAREVERYGLASTVRRSDVAAWMVAALEAEPPFPRRTVLLGK
ncbi:MAG TPA: NAD(P)H-binding protein, partial [Longimicrobiaceae bacterium]|nr:NAD(P)H-binding protein [Longimicrobiaceae bacterium]